MILLVLLESHEDGLLELLRDLVRNRYTVFGLRHELHSQEKLGLSKRVSALWIDELPDLGANLSGKLCLSNDFLHLLIRYRIGLVFVEV